MHKKITYLHINDTFHKGTVSTSDFPQQLSQLCAPSIRAGHWALIPNSCRQHPATGSRAGFPAMAFPPPLHREKFCERKYLGQELLRCSDLFRVLSCKTVTFQFISLQHATLRVCISSRPILQLLYMTVTSPRKQLIHHQLKRAGPVQLDGKVKVLYCCHRGQFIHGAAFVTLAPRVLQTG